MEAMDFLDPPWFEGPAGCIVHGSNLPFVPDERGGPQSKYAALFDDRSESDWLRLFFFARHAGQV